MKTQIPSELFALEYSPHFKRFHVTHQQKWFTVALFTSAEKALNRADFYRGWVAFTSSDLREEALCLILKISN